MMDHIALLRGVNVGGRSQVAMADLQALFAKIGLPGARSLLQSGNLVFAGDGRTCAEFERLMESETERQLGLSVDYFVRTAAQWREIIARNPFPREAKDDPSHLLVIFLKRAPSAGDLEALRAAIQGRERVQVVGSQAYIVYPDGIGRSKLTMAKIEKKLATRGTGRKWNTVEKLAALTLA